MSVHRSATLALVQRRSMVKRLEQHIRVKGATTASTSVGTWFGNGGGAIERAACRVWRTDRPGRKKHRVPSLPTYG